MANDNAIRFMDNSFSDSTVYDNGDITFSSENSSYPKQNACNPNRSKLWKPNGNFEITSSNNKVYINDGSDQTATLTTGYYSGGAALASEIQTQLNAVSSSWTCTYSSSTYKFTIERTSGTNVLKLTSTTNAAWNTIGFTTGSDLSTDPFEADSIRVHTDEWIRIDCATPQVLTFLGVIGPIGEVFSINSNATIKLQANSVDAWTSPPLDLTVTSTNRGIFKFIESTENSTAYRYWRFYFQDIDNPSGPSAFSVGNIYIGDYTTITSSNVARGFQKQQIDPSIRLESMSGALYHDQRTKYEIFRNMVCQNISAADRLNLEQIFNDFGLHTPLFVSLDPKVQVSNSIDELTKYFYFESAPIINHVFMDVFQFGFSLREAV